MARSPLVVLPIMQNEDLRSAYVTGLSRCSANLLRLQRGNLEVSKASILSSDQIFVDVIVSIASSMFKTRTNAGEACIDAY